MQEVDLSEDFDEYDEDNDAPVSMYECLPA